MQLLLQLIYNLFNITWNVFLLRLIIMDYSEYTKQRILFYWFKGSTDQMQGITRTRFARILYAFSAAGERVYRCG